MLSYQITHQDHCRRLESYLRNLMPTSPFGYVRKLIKSGAAKLNGAAETADFLLKVNDTVTLKESGATSGFILSARPALDILFEDEQIVIANKPSGLSMHRTAEFTDNLVEVGQAYMIHRKTPCKLYPVNRLDRGTSGTVIMAKSSNSAAIYGRQVQDTGLDKLYLALVHGTPDSCGIVDEPLDEKESETRYRILFSGANCSLLAVTPISGRTHQIRRHFSMIGHPVVADKRYGGRELPDFPGFALHSFRTVLPREESAALTVCAPIPDETLALCEQQGIERNLLLEAVYRLTEN